MFNDILDILNYKNKNPIIDSSMFRGVSEGFATRVNTKEESEPSD